MYITVSSEYNHYMTSTKTTTTHAPRIVQVFGCHYEWHCSCGERSAFYGYREAIAKNAEHHARTA